MFFYTQRFMSNMPRMNPEAAGETLEYLGGGLPDSSG
uniref:Uncharacterized protein n=1 Tax=uncultured Desulfobacterium sp. TaxID=201089 RepID=E1YEE0_9BACT|nr:unknown protein [uncultured Desulfobacterium sp.]